MGNDTAFANEESEPTSVSYDALFGGQSEEGAEAELQLSRKAIPPFDYYVLSFEGGKGTFSKDGAPGIRFMARVAEGPTGTEGAPLFDGVYFNVKPTKNIKVGGVKKEIQRTAQEVEEAREKMRLTLRRVANRLGFSNTFPLDFTQEALDSYGAQFSGTVVAAVSKKAASSGPDGTEYPEGNNIILASVRSLEEEREVKVAGKVEKMSALEEARMQIEAQNKKETKKAGSGRMQAGTFGKAAATRNPFAA